MFTCCRGRRVSIDLICSFNCRGLGSFEKRRDVLNYLRRSQFNIFMLQDIHCKPENENNFRNTWGGDIKLAGFSNNSRGVAILSKSIGLKYTDTRTPAPCWGGAFERPPLISEKTAARSAAGFSPITPHLFRNFCVTIDQCHVRSGAGVTQLQNNFPIAPRSMFQGKL